MLVLIIKAKISFNIIANFISYINHDNNIYYNISFENDNISEIDFEFKSIENNKNSYNNLNDNKKIRIIRSKVSIIICRDYIRR